MLNAYPFFIIKSMKVWIILSIVAMCAGCSGTIHSTTAQAEPIESTADPIYYYDMDVWQNVAASLTPAQYITQWLDSFINDGDQLLTSIEGKGIIQWEVVEGDATIDETMVIHKTETSQEYQPITLKAIYTDENGSMEIECPSNVLIDPYVGYVLSYFVSEGDDSEALKLAYTYDGELWYKVNDQHSVYKPSIGTTSLRDPSFVRRKDGGFVLLATQGWNNPEIYAIDTDNFIHYDNERLIDVNVSTDDLPLSENAAWAPEGFYDYQTDRYYIYWSSVEDAKVLYNTTTDFDTVSDPSVLIDLGYPVIDATIYKDGAHYYVLLKDEREPMEAYSNIFVGSSSTDFLSFNQFSDAVTNHQAEGPFVVWSDYKHLLYFDDYTRQQFYCMWIDFENGFTQVENDETNISDFVEPSHGSVIPVTWNELESLIPYSE